MFADSILASCGGGRRNMPRPLQVDLWPFDLESGVRVACDVGHLCAILVFPGLSVLDLRPMYATDRRQTSVAHHRLMPSPSGRGIIITSTIANEWMNERKFNKIMKINHSQDTQDHKTHALKIKISKSGEYN